MQCQLPRMGKGQEVSAGGNWALTVFYKHCVEGVLLYTPQRNYKCSFTSGAPGPQTLSPHWMLLPSIDIGSTWSLDGACWAPLLVNTPAERLLEHMLSPLPLCGHRSVTPGANIALREKRTEINLQVVHNFRKMPFPNHVRIMISPVPSQPGGWQCVSERKVL